MTTPLQRFTAQGRALMQRVKPQSSSVRNVLKLAGGTAGSQVITVAASPILTRLYGPESFGVLASFASILALLNVVSSLQYELAIAVAEDDDEAIALVWLCFVLVAISTALTALGVALLGNQLLGWLQQPALKPLLWLLPVGVLLTGVYQPLSYWAIRRKQFGLLAQTKFRQSIFGVAINLATAPLGTIGLLLGQIVSQSAGIEAFARENASHLWALRARASLVRNLKTFSRKDHFINPQNLFARFYISLGYLLRYGFPLAKNVSRKYHEFATYGSIACVLNSCALHLPILIIGAHYRDTQLGLLALAQRILLVPIAIISSSTSQFLLSESASRHRSNQILGYTNKTSKKLAVVAILIVGFVLVLAPLLPIVFGDRWTSVSKLVPLLLPMLCGQIIISPLSSLMTGAQKNRESIQGQVCYVLLRVLPLSILVNHIDFYGAVLAYSLFSLLGYACYYDNMIYTFKNSESCL